MGLRLFRSPDLPPELPEPGWLVRMREQIATGQMTAYQDGLAAGMEIALTLALGHDSHGGTPYPGNHDQKFVDWAEQALKRIRSER